MAICFSIMKMVVLLPFFFAFFFWSWKLFLIIWSNFSAAQPKLPCTVNKPAGVNTMEPCAAPAVSPNGQLTSHDKLDRRQALAGEEDNLNLLGGVTFGGAGVGYLIGCVVIAVDEPRKMFSRPELAPLTGAIAGYCLGRLAYHGVCAVNDGWQKVKVVSGKVSRYLAESAGLKPLYDESAIVKACISFGALYNIFANRELMCSLTEFENPFPDSRLCWFAMEGGRELIITPGLALTGAAIGYVGGKGIEGAAKAVCSSVNLATRGVMACINAVTARLGNGLE